MKNIGLLYSVKFLINNLCDLVKNWSQNPNGLFVATVTFTKDVNSTCNLKKEMLFHVFKSLLWDITSGITFFIAWLNWKTNEEEITYKEIISAFNVKCTKSQIFVIDILSFHKPKTEFECTNACYHIVRNHT